MNTNQQKEQSEVKFSKYNRPAILGIILLLGGFVLGLLAQPDREYSAPGHYDSELEFYRDR